MKRSLSESDLLRLADLNRVEFWADSAKWMPGTEIIHSRDTVFINSAIEFPASNLAFNMAVDSKESPAAFLGRVKDFFATRKPNFSLLLRGHADQPYIKYYMENKLLLTGEAPGMVLDAPVKLGKLPSGTRLQWVDDEKGLRDFGKIASEAFTDLGFPQQIGERFFVDVKKVLNAYCILAVIYLGDEPASVAMAMLSHGIAGIYWVATAKEVRGQGLGEYCTRQVGNASFDLGARKVILQASKFGEPVYRKIGYREITRYPWFICSSK
jgi:ribosomal protein S18 acetylase RimI-like enzyme